MVDLVNDTRDFFEDLKKKPRPNIFRRIWLWWNHDGRYAHKTFANGVKNLWYWFPIIWKDRNWDSHYLFEVMKHKLVSQANYIGRRDFHTRAQQDARNMRICVKLIQNIQDDVYTLEYTDYSKDRHWFEPCNDGTENSTWESENIWEKYDDYFKKYPLVYKRVMNGEGFTSLKGREDDKHVIALSIAHLNHQRAKSLLYKIMDTQIEGWWD
jgi:hypothetical protein